MKLAIFNPFAERLGGSDNILWNYLRHLGRDSIEPVVIFRGEGPFEREVAGLGIRTYTVPDGRLASRSARRGRSVDLRRSCGWRPPT